jgi:DHA3 family macrolide efflux protein-like MFS transporter
MEKQQPKWQIPFFTIWTGQQLSLIGSQVAQFALIWWLTKTTGSATVLAMASLVGLLPGIVLGPFVGALIDRWNRRIVMLVADTVVALASLWLAYLFWIDALQIWHVYVIMFVRAVGGGFHWPAMDASTSLMVPKEQLTRVAGLNQTVKGALNIIGAPLGALLMELLPLFGVMLVDVGTAAFAIAPLFFVRIPQPASADKDEAQKSSLWTDMGDGLRYIRDWSGLMALIGVALVVKIVLTPAFSLIPLLVSEHFSGDAAQLSLLEAIVGIGFIVGGLVLSVWGGFRRKIYTTALGMGALGLGLVALGLAPGGWFWMALASVLLIGLSIPLVDGPIMAILQGSVAPEMQGRVFTMMSSLLNLSSPFSLAIAGPVTDWLGITVWYVVAGVLCLLAGSAVFFMPAIVNIEQNNNGHRAKDELSLVTTEAAPVRVETE